MAFPSAKNFLTLHGRRLCLFQGMVPGFNQANDSWLGGDAFQGVLQGVAAGLVTLAAQSSQALGFPVQAAVNQFSTVASGSYIILPPAVMGMLITIAHDGSNNAQVCGSAATLDTIDGIATATGVTLTAARRGFYLATNTALLASGTAAAVPGTWVSWYGLKSA